jgi:hypothetical protein
VKVATVDITLPSNSSDLSNSMMGHNISAFATTHTLSPHNPFRRQQVLPTNPFLRYLPNSAAPTDRGTADTATSDYHLFVASIGSGLVGAPVATYADSGASHHYFVDRSDFDTYMEISPVVGQAAGKDSTFQIVGIGSVHVTISPFWPCFWPSSFLFLHQVHALLKSLCKKTTKTSHNKIVLRIQQ